ncbi:MAG: glycoside hydrolase family 5 protein [Anaerolineales bacterium]
MDKTGFHSGVNMGGWLSQYPAFDYRHFDTFITPLDIRRIADWGCDHVRLPVDFPVLEADGQPGTMNERGLAYVVGALEECRANGLSVILDLHKAPGYSFDDHRSTALFDDPTLQSRFLDIWQAIAMHLAGTQNFVAFELLNEVNLPDSAAWNQLVAEAVERIRAVDPERLIVVGGNHYNAPEELEHLTVLKDAGILYTFHFYVPMVVTHQFAPWVPPLLEYGQRVDYPGRAAGLEGIIERHPDFAPVIKPLVGKLYDRDFLLKAVLPAFDFARRKNQAVYCGEYGVIDRASLETRLHWTADLVSILREHGIGRAAWSYKAMDFGLVDLQGKIVSEELVRLVCAP